jgi:hypothetical protein
MWRTGPNVLRGFLAVTSAATLAACAIALPSSSSKSAGTSEQACEDMADAVAKADVRCSLGTYAARFKAFVDAAAAGDCKNIVKVRDTEALYDTCFPTLQTINCLELSNGNLDASCKQQLQTQ